jgi:hypothetical protein
MQNPSDRFRSNVFAFIAMRACLGVIAGLFLFGIQAQANTRSLTRSGVSEEITLNLLKSKVPQGATVTDTSCKEIQTAGFNYSYRCTITWEEN